MLVARKVWIFAVVLTASFGFAAPKSSEPSTPQPGARSQMDVVTDGIFYREAKLVEAMHKYTPLVETYIQNTKQDNELGEVPVSDKYFLGRLVLDKHGITDKSFDKKKAGMFSRVLDRLDGFYKMKYLPQGFMQLVFLSNGFDKKNYDLKYQRQEFLGDVRTLVFDVVPHKKIKGTHFVGRIWVEDQDHNIVRINGTYEPQRGGNFYFHFDSWRMNMQPGLWLPALVYTEDGDVKYDLVRKISMKGQTRLWGYDLKHSGRQTEFTDMQVESVKDVNDRSGDGANEMSPLESRHKWQREAEDNVLDRMERAGVLAPAGEVSKILETVANNLEVTNNLNIEPEVRCRVLLTTPLESFTVGNTIVMSRGLLDVLPDEASLAMMISHELAHIALGHSVNTKYAFSDRLIFPDEQVMQKIGMQRNDSDEDAADKKAVEMLRNSPYKDKMRNAGLFLRALQAHGHELTWLISPNFGNKMAKGSDVLRMESLIPTAPELKVNDVHQLAALPLGSRIKLDPWDDHVNLKKSKPEVVISARDKLPFEVTPMIPNLVRAGQTTNEVAENSGAKSQ
jgi:Zn-dependent protease with chaperone function